MYTVILSSKILTLFTYNYGLKNRHYFLPTILFFHVLSTDADLHQSECAVGLKCVSAHPGHAYPAWRDGFRGGAGARGTARPVVCCQGQLVPARVGVALHRLLHAATGNGHSEFKLNCCNNNLIIISWWKRINLSVKNMLHSKKTHTNIKTFREHRKFENNCCYNNSIIISRQQRFLTLSVLKICCTVMKRQTKSTLFAAGDHSAWDQPAATALCRRSTRARPIKGSGIDSGYHLTLCHKYKNFICVWSIAYCSTVLCYY